MTRENCAARCDAGMMAPMSFMSRFRLAWRTATAGDDAMPDGVRPPSRAAAADPLRISTVFRGVQVLQTAITGLPIDVYVDGVRTARQPAIIRQPDTRRSRRDVISDLVAPDSGMLIEPTIGIGGIALVLGICLFIGLVFSSGPAHRAARIDATEALRGR